MHITFTHCVQHVRAALTTTRCRGWLGAEIIELEKDLPIPIGRALDPESIVGVDRLLTAAAAWDELKQACIVWMPAPR